MNFFSVEVPDNRLDLRLCVSSGQVFRWQQLDSDRLLGVDGPRWFLVESATGAFKVKTNGQEDDFKRLFRLDWDASEIEAKIRKLDPILAPFLEVQRGLRVMRPSSAEETFFSFLCTPNNNVARITQMVRTLAMYGQPLAKIENVQLHRFPTAEVIASIPEAELREKKFGYRAATITSAAAQLLDRGEGWLDSLKKVPYQEAHNHLLSIKGIGRKLADCIALFALDHGEAVPVDTHVWQQVVRLYRPEWRGKPLSDSRYLEAGAIFRERFGELAGWAHQYLFYDNLLNSRSR